MNVCGSNSSSEHKHYISGLKTVVVCTTLSKRRETSRLSATVMRATHQVLGELTALNYETELLTKKSVDDLKFLLQALSV